MKKNKDKPNADYLKEMLTTIKGLLPKEGEEAMEFFEAMVDEKEGGARDEVDGLKDRISELEREIEEKDERIEELEQKELDETVDLGLDTLKWELTNGNLVLTELMENFIESVKKKYAMLPA